MMKNQNYNTNILNYFSRFTFDTIFYGIGNFVHKLTTLAIYFIIVNKFTVEEFGIFDFYITIINFVIILIAFGQDSALARLLYDKKEINFKKEIISQSLHLQILFLILVIFILYFVLFFFKIEFLDSKILNYIVILQIPFFFFINFCLNVFKWTFERNSYLIIMLGNAILIFLTVLIFSNFLNLNLALVLSIYFFFYILFSIIAFILIYKWINFEFKTNHYQQLFLFAYPYGLISITMIGVPLIERSMIIYYINMNSLGIYALATKISMFVYLFINTFHIAWGPSSYSIYKSKNYKDYYKLIFKIYILVSIFLMILISSLSNKFVNLFGGEDFSSAKNLIFPISLSIIIYSCSEISGIAINLKKKPLYSLFSYIMYLLIFLLIGFFTISQYGIYGLAWSLVIASIFLLLIESFISKKLLNINFEFIYSIFIFLFFISLLFLNNKYSYNEYFNLNNLIVLIFYFTLFSLVVLIYLNKNEKKIIKKFLRN